jgi:protein ImuB
MRRYLSVWLRRLSTDRIERRLSAPADGPRVVVASIESAQRIVALNDDAARLGLKAGMPLTDARAMYPSLPVADADFEADRQLLESIADWCDRYTPLVGLDPPDGLVLDVTGCAHLFGGEAAMARDMIARLKQQGFRSRVAVADTVGGAWGVARHGDALIAVPSPLVGEGSSEVQHKERVRGPVQPLTQRNLLNPRCSPLPQGERAREASAESAKSVFIIPRGETEAAVLPLPIASLRIDAEIVAELASLGLKRAADLSTRPRAPLAARFGEMLVRRLDQALGREDEPITPRLPVPAAMAERCFPEPIAREDDVLGTIEHLARELARVLERRGEGARLIQTVLFRSDGKVHRLEIGTGAPLRDPTRVRRLFEDRLAALGDACDPGFGYDMVRLSALVTERIDPGQTGFAVPDHAEELAHLIDRLGARFGLRRVTRLVPQDTHIPEYAVAAVPAHAARHIPAASAIEQDSINAIRPLRLLPKPQGIFVVSEVPDGPPVRFLWKHEGREWLEAWQREWQYVALYEGPERIAMEWWRDDRGNNLTRDYFRIETDAGARMWLYREGLYDREIRNPRWYLHGLFA